VNRTPNGRLPAAVRSTLWSYDLSAVDAWRDRELVIMQVLNYGDWTGVRWLLKTYGVDEVRKVVRHPQRGMWWPKALNYWLTVLDAKLPRPVFERATVRMTPEAVSCKLLAASGWRSARRACRLLGTWWVSDCPGADRPPQGGDCRPVGRKRRQACRPARPQNRRAGMNRESPAAR